MVPYAIGLDIGISSVGWATVALDRSDRPYGILKMGARIFDAAENPKTGASLAAPRREARSARRRLRRHRHRNERIRNLLIGSKVITEEELTHLFEGQLSDIYTLRVRALDELMNNRELARILIHIAQRRGFRSNRVGAADKENGELLSAVTANRERMAQNGYRTIAEMYLKDERFQDHRRNKGGQYISTVSRDMVEEEVRRIFEAQRQLGSPWADEKLEEAYLGILLSQRSFDEGPGEGSPYAGSQIARMVGKCTLLPEETRAARATYSFEYFSLLSAVNHLRLVSGKASVPLNAVQRRTLIELAHKTADLNYGKLRKELALTDDQTFNAVSYRKGEERDEAEKKSKFVQMKAYHEMRRAFDRAAKGHFADITREQRNAIGETLSRYKTHSTIYDELKKAGLSDPDIAIAETLSFSKFGHVSVKACDMLIPYLEQGMKYNEACEAAGLNFKGHDAGERSRFLPPLDEDARNTITSPVVQRAVSQAIKVVNAIIRERGQQPTFLNIELAREMSKDIVERRQLEKEQKENSARNERLMDQIRREYKHTSPTGQDLVKMKLWEEQGGICAYSQKSISIEHLFDADYAEVDHIIPYSISFDDGYKNKVLVLAKENRDKGNRLPLEYLTGKRREDFIVWVNSSIRDYRKRQRLLKEHITAEDESGFIERNLQDTKTASAFLMNYINDHLDFAPFQGSGKKHVTAVNGSVTGYMRKRWGISKIRANGDLHHAVDALVVVCTTDAFIQKVSRYAKYRESRYMQEAAERFLIDPDTGEIIQEFPYPWPHFRQELEARLSMDPAAAMEQLKYPILTPEDREIKPIFVSRMPRHKVTGAAHLETIKSGKLLSDGLLIAKKPLTDLKLDKDGEIKDYYNPQSDRLLYEALKARLHQFDGDAKKAFAEPFRKPKHDGTPGPIVNKVQLSEPSTIQVPVLKGTGFANNDSMVRIDVFRIAGDGYYFVPIYTADIVKPELPIQACTRGKPFKEWKRMKQDDFLFSLFPNDLIKVTSQKNITLTKARQDSDLDDTYSVTSEFMYFVSASISTASFKCETHDGAYMISSLGIKTLLSLEKYAVDVLGNYYPVKREIRQRFPGQRS